jgi:hypothetical protein
MEISAKMHFHQWIDAFFSKSLVVIFALLTCGLMAAISFGQQLSVAGKWQAVQGNSDELLELNGDGTMQTGSVEQPGHYELGREFSGMEAGAMWEDFKIGVEHLSRWERVAVVTDVDWIRHAVNVFRFLMPGEVQVFATSKAAAVRQWITAARA